MVLFGEEKKIELLHVSFGFSELTNSIIVTALCFIHLSQHWEASQFNFTRLTLTFPENSPSTRSLRNAKHPKKE